MVLPISIKRSHCLCLYDTKENIQSKLFVTYILMQQVLQVFLAQDLKYKEDSLSYISNKISELVKKFNDLTGDVSLPKHLGHCIIFLLFYTGEKHLI